MPRFPTAPQEPPRPSREGLVLESLIWLLWLFLRSIIRTCLSSVLQLVLATLALFHLLNLCFSSLFHTHTDNLPSPQGPGMSARR